MEIAVPAMELSWSSSSIGEDSDRRSDGEGSSGEKEVESPYNKGPIDSLDSLEAALPIRRGLSRFYHGHSKSFTSRLSDAITSVSAIVKPENAYTRRRRRNQLAKKIMLFPKTPPGNVLGIKEGKISKILPTGHSSSNCKLQDKQYGKKNRSLLSSDLKELVAASSSSSTEVKSDRTTSTGNITS